MTNTTNPMQFLNANPSHDSSLSALELNNALFIFFIDNLLWSCYRFYWFLPRDVMRKRGLCRRAVSVLVCLSVRPYVTFVYCVETSENIIILVFSTKPHGNIPTENSLTGTSNAGGVWKDRDFRPISQCISKTIQDSAIVTTERQ